MEGEGTGSSEGEAEHITPRQDVILPVFLEPDSITYTEVSTESATSSTSSGSSSASGGSTTRSTVPFYEFEPFKEVSSIQDYSVEEIVEKYIAWIKNQPDRRAQLKIRQGSPIPIVTPFVKPLPVREKDIQALKERVYSRYALPASEADRMIEERRAQFLADAESLGLVEVSKEGTRELTPQSMRRK